MPSASLVSRSVKDDMTGKDPRMQLCNSLPWHIRLKIANFPEENVTREKIV